MIDHLSEALERREASEARMRRFVADASHELRTPITTIRGYAELYRHGGLGDAGALDDAMGRTEAEAVRMQRLVEDMLTLAKLDEQRPLERVPVDLVGIARDVVADASVVRPGRSLEAVADPSTALVVGDPDRMRQAVTNLVANALGYTAGPVTVRVVGAEGRVRLVVADEGPGMSPEVLARATERLFRADPARSRRRGGSGLGLSIAESSVAAMDGTLTITSAPDAGTTVTLDFPAA